ncbi:MAG TPA: glycosyltransferase family 39 protein [Candidatus Acidoferrales bacterium]
MRQDPPAEEQPSRRWRRLIVPGLLCLVYVAQGVWFIRTQSLTYDEPEHICAGLEALRYGEFRSHDDQPPLGRMFFALPMLSTDWKCVPAVNDTNAQPERPEPQTWALRARPMNLLLGLATALLLWWEARRMFSEAAANFALGLFVFLPQFVANFSLATMDGPGTLMISAFVVQWARWRQNATNGNALLLSLLMGGAILAKFNALPLVALGLGLVLTGTKEGFVFHPRRMNWRTMFAVLAVVIVMVWTFYFFHISYVTFSDGQVRATFPALTKELVYDVPVHWNVSFYLPACEFFTGLGNQIHHGWVRGHRSFFLGEVSQRGGWRLYFPVVMALKWPAVFLGMFLFTVALVLWRKISWPREYLGMLLFPGFYFLIALNSQVNIGDRHLLPVLWFALLGTAALWQWAKGRRAAQLVLLSLMVLNAADVLRYAPDYLSYFNVFVRPGESWRLLSDSNLDWGQGLLALRKYEDQHPGEAMHLAYFGIVEPWRYGIRSVPFGEQERPTGTVIVSATHLSGERLNDPRAYQWLLRCRQKALLNHTLHVFEVSPEACGQASR